MYTRDQLEKLPSDVLRDMLANCENEVAKCDVMQLGLKVTLNSAYGMIGNQYSRYFDTRIAEGITVSGQLSIRWIERKLDEYLNRICGTDDLQFAVAGDTDSIYITLAPFVEKYFPKDAPKGKIVRALDKLCEERIQGVIDAAYQELADYMNAFAQKMFMAREVIADRGLWRAKKNYALNVWDSEGVQYDEPELKIMGLESARSQTPEVCRNALSESIRLMMTSDEKAVQRFIADFKKKFFDLPVEDIARNTGISDIAKWNVNEGFQSGTPYHVKGAMVYNRMLRRLKLQTQYRSVQNGDKVKLLYLKKANPTHNNTIAFPDVLPPEFNLEEYVDRKMQWTKNYYDPVNSLLSIIGWTPIKVNTLW